MIDITFTAKLGNLRKRSWYPQGLIGQTQSQVLADFDWYSILLFDNGELWVN